MKNILIADDHAVVLEGLSVVLMNEGYEVMKALSVEEALSLSKKKKIDIMVIDLTLNEDADGLSLIKRLRKNGVKAPVVVYTMHEELWNIALLLDADVEGIVLKGESIDELIEAIQTVGDGGTYRSAIFRDRMANLKSSPSILSAKESNIINLIGRGESTGEIAEKMNISHKAVEYHRSNIMKKLDAKNMTEAIKNAVKLGIITSILMGTPLATDAQDFTVPNPVDLGLSVKWADRNLGAALPAEPGGYYSFGETEEKEVYSWDTYSHCDGGDMFSQHDLGEESICGTEYDVAHVKLGGDWRMPSLSEIEELMENCTVEKIPEEEGNLCQVKMTSVNGQSISFPITGYMNNGKLLYQNKETELTSGTMEVEAGEEDGFVYRMNSPYALALTAKGEVISIQVSSHLGFQIRPVLDENPNDVESIGAENNTTAIYTIGGRYVGTSTRALPRGIYIRVKGERTEKIIR